MVCTHATLRLRKAGRASLWGEKRNAKPKDYVIPKRRSQGDGTRTLLMHSVAQSITSIQYALVQCGPSRSLAHPFATTMAVDRCPWITTCHGQPRTGWMVKGDCATLHEPCNYKRDDDGQRPSIHASIHSVEPVIWRQNAGMHTHNERGNLAHLADHGHGHGDHDYHGHDD